MDLVYYDPCQTCAPFGYGECEGHMKTNSCPAGALHSRAEQRAEVAVLVNDVGTVLGLMHKQMGTNIGEIMDGMRSLAALPHLYVDLGARVDRLLTKLEELKLLPTEEEWESQPTESSATD